MYRNVHVDLVKGGGGCSRSLMFIAWWFQGFGPLITMTSVLKVKEHKSDPLFLSVPEKDICFAPVSSSTLHSSYIKEKGEGNTSVLLDRKAYFGYLGANNFFFPSLPKHAPSKQCQW